MKIRKSRILLGVTGLLTLVLIGGGLFLNSAIAQGPGQGRNPSNVMHDNQAVLDLLHSTEGELLQLRQEGESWLDIATTKGVTEAALLDAMLKPMNEMHAQMAQSYPQLDGAQMSEWMKTQLKQDLSVTQFGRMADRHVLGDGGMMSSGNPNDLDGMWCDQGMMGNLTNGANGFGGMMRGWGMMHGGGMMHGWSNLWNVTPGPAQ